MKASVVATAGAPLLFNWEAPRRRYLAIAGFLAASVFAHAFCFYLFQIVYPPIVSLLPPPARVSLISLSSDEGRTLLQWVEAEDPALATTTQRPLEAKNYGLPKIEHVPSYSNYEPALKTAPPLVVDLSVPSAQPPASVPRVRAKTSTSVTVARTSVSFSQELQDLGAPILPSAKFVQSGNEQPSDVRCRVGVSAGAVHYCFPLNSSGDASLDEQAREYLVLCRFPERSASSNGGSVVWGTATIQWGNDLERGSARSTSTPSP
jgi:hypothetical protein